MGGGDRDQGGRGPNATLIGAYCDATIRGLVLDAAAPCKIQAVNTPMCIFNFGGYTDLATASVGLVSAPGFQGTPRLFNTIVFAGPYWDFNINGGDISLEVVHMDNANMDSVVNGGVFRLVNSSSRNTGGNSSAYNVAFAAGAGASGKTNEFIGCYHDYGCTWTNANAGNPVNAWGNFGLSTNPPVVSGLTATPGGSRVTVSWTAETNALSYNVKRSTLSGGPFVLVTNAAAASYLDADVVSNATYKTLFKIVLNTTASPNDYPRGYQVHLSNDGSNWGNPVAAGAGYSAATTITFAPQTARYVRITQTGSASGNYWSIHELNLYGTPPAAPDPLVALPGTNAITLSWSIPRDAAS